MPVDEPFPSVQPGGSLLLAWQVKGKSVLVVGGGEVAAGRILNALNADACVTVVAPRAGLNAEVAWRVDEKQVRHVDRVFQASDLDGVDMVMTAVDDAVASSQIYYLCQERRIAANIADVPPECDFYFGAIHRDGPLQVLISTNGRGPRLAGLVKRHIAATLPPNIGNVIQRVGVLRQKLRVKAPEASEGPKRMRWISQVCDDWALHELAALDDTDMDRLLDAYVSGNVPSYNDIIGMDVFDGSFGWAV